MDPEGDAGDVYRWCGDGADGDAASTAGVTYSLDPAGPYDPGTDGYTVTVTATLADGLKWGTMPPGWTQVDLTTATFTVDVDRRRRVTR